MTNTAVQLSDETPRIASHAPAAFYAPETVARRKYRVFVVEDHAFVRRCLAALLNRQPDLVCCGEAATVAEAVDLIAETAPELVVLGLQLRDGDGLDLMEFLRIQAPSLLVLVLGQSTDPFQIERVLRSGANGYLAKHASSDEMLKAIHTLLLGSVYVTHELAIRMLCNLLNR